MITPKIKENSPEENCFSNIIMKIAGKANNSFLKKTLFSVDFLIISNEKY